MQKSVDMWIVFVDKFYIIWYAKRLGIFLTDEHNVLWTNINVGKERLSTWNGDRIFLTAGQQSGIKNE